MKSPSGAGPSKFRLKHFRLNIGVFGIVAIAAYLGLMTFLNTSNPFVVTRGTSMEPVYHEGDLLINRKVPATELSPGDIIVFDVPEDAQKELRMPPRAAHRIVSVSAEDGELAYVTKGDNSDVDPFKVKSGAVTGLVVKNLGPLGRPILMVSNPRVLLFLGLPIVVFVVVVMASLKSSSGQSEAQKVKPGAVSTEPSSNYFQAETEKLATAIAEYGAHLESHTAIVKGMSSASERLEGSVQVQNDTNAELNEAVHRQNQILAGLLIAVENLHEQSADVQKSKTKKDRAKPKKNKPSIVDTEPVPFV